MGDLECMYMPAYVNHSRLHSLLLFTMIAFHLKACFLNPLSEYSTGSTLLLTSKIIWRKTEEKIKVGHLKEINLVCCRASFT